MYILFKTEKQERTKIFYKQATIRHVSKLLGMITPENEQSPSLHMLL